MIYMKIAIISMFGHFECLFFLCEILQEHKITLYIANHTKGEEYAICKAYSNIEVIKITENLSEDILSIYDETIKLSSNDSVLHHSRVISLLHLSSLKDNSNRYISLSPFVEGENVSYMLPVYNPIEVRICYNKSITYVGYFLNSWVDEDLQYFIENSHHNFNFVVWGDGNYDNLTRFPNVRLYCNVQYEHLSEIINDSSSDDDESVSSEPEPLNFNISSPSSNSNEELLGCGMESLDLSSDTGLDSGSDDGSDDGSELSFDARFEKEFTIIPSSTSSSCKMEEDLEEKLDDEPEQEFKESKSILIKVSKMIMDITASDDFSIKLENSHRVLDMVQKMLHL